MVANPEVETKLVEILKQLAPSNGALIDFSFAARNILAAKDREIFMIIMNYFPHLYSEGLYYLRNDFNFIDKREILLLIDKHRLLCAQ